MSHGNHVSSAAAGAPSSAGGSPPPLTLPAPASAPTNHGPARQRAGRPRLLQEDAPAPAGQDMGGLNDTTGAFAEITIYDRIFSWMKCIEAIMAAYGLKDPSEVTAKMLAEACRMGGEKPLSSSQLCGNKRLVIGLTDKAFTALKAVCESEDPRVDISSLSKNLLDNQIILSDLKPHPLEQSFLIHVLSRYKKHQGKAPVRDNLKFLRVRVLQAGDLYRRVESVIPSGSWTPEFQRCFEDLLYGKHSEWETCGYGHMATQDDNVENLRASLPAGTTFPPEHVKTVKAKLPSRLVRIARKSPDLRGFLEAWEQRMAEVNSFIEQQKHIWDSSDSSDSSSDDEDSPEEDSLCKRCKLSSPTKYSCPECGVLHSASCEITVQPEEDESDTDDRPCKDCVRDKRPKKKRRKNDRSTLPQTGSTSMETGMLRSTLVHSEPLFVGSPPRLQHPTVNTPPKLAFIDLTRETHLLKNTDAANKAMKMTLQAFVDALHPQGTMAIAIPRPWHTLGALFKNCLNGLERCQVDGHPLIIEYGNVPGEAIEKGRDNHVRNQTEQVMIVHSNLTPDKPCNRRVVVSDVFGQSTGHFPHNKQVLHLESLPSGAPNGDSRRFFPEKAAHLLIGRFTNATDTVLGVGVETTTVAEHAIEHGRCVEFFVLEEAKRVVLERNITDAVRTAHGRGMFQSRLGQEVLVGPDLLPCGPQQDTVPVRVKDELETESEEKEKELAACFAVAQSTAKTANVDLKVEVGCHVST